MLHHVAQMGGCGRGTTKQAAFTTGTVRVHAKTSSRSSLFLPMNRRSSLRSGRGLRPRFVHLQDMGGGSFESVSGSWRGV